MEGGFFLTEKSEMVKEAICTSILQALKLRRQSSGRQGFVLTQLLIEYRIADIETFSKLNVSSSEIVVAFLLEFFLRGQLCFVVDFRKPPSSIRDVQCLKVENILGSCHYFLVL